MGIFDSVVKNVERSIVNKASSSITSGIGKGIDNSVKKATTPKCPKCKTEIPIPSPAFCSKCGTKLGKVCSKCNTSFGLDVAFCNKCGTKL